MSGATDLLLVLTGSTAAGKKEVGLELARRLDAEVIAIDSVKVYAGLRIGGAQPDAADLAGVRMHLVGIADPNDAFGVGRWLEAAATATAEIRARGRVPLFLGGTPMFLHALIRGFFDGPPADPALRERLEAEAAANGTESLHARLDVVDPESAAWIGPRDLKRIVRALEVHTACGRPISALQREGTRRRIAGDLRVAGLTASDELLRERQASRVDRMLERGLVAEVRELTEAGRLKGEAARAIGYREISEHLAGATTLQQARDAIVRDTWELTRKQRKWFRRLEEVKWVERRRESTLEELVGAVLGAWGLATGDQGSIDP